MRRHPSRLQSTARIAAFVPSSIDVEEMETTARAFGAHGCRLALLSNERSMVSGRSSNAEINFAVSAGAGDVDVNDYSGLVLLDGADCLESEAKEAIARFMRSNKPILAMASSIPVVANVTGAKISDLAEAALVVNGEVYASGDGDSAQEEAVEVFARQLAA